MNWGTAIIGISALALCALPFILDRFSRSRKEKQLLGILQGAAHQHDCKVDIHGTCGRIALGLDEGRKPSSATHSVRIGTLQSTLT
ncbi:MAG: hypothetical protein IPI72_02485 [Flavobacteriales bacterium]|nr:hypothetical protein [Flavobacteriales bacterium]